MSFKKSAFFIATALLISISIISKVKASQEWSMDHEDSCVIQISGNNNKKYPLLDDVFHQKKILFRDAAKQLKSGKFRKAFRQGMLFHGPPGSGKNAVV
ncbi:MAG TPA: hypothetical protein ENI08_03225 [Candidatus Dependentiae bacterium]|nr:hypothetical protein [Candidatus Dependentiae bacterium]